MGVFTSLQTAFTRSGRSLPGQARPPHPTAASPSLSTRPNPRSRVPGSPDTVRRSHRACASIARMPLPCSSAPGVRSPVLARRLPACLAVFLLALTCLRGSTFEAARHELYEAARNHLRNGQLQSAEVLLTRLRNMVSRGSQWDPDGTFANELLPPLLARLRRMKSVSLQLDEFSDHALKDLRP